MNRQAAINYVKQHYTYRKIDGEQRRNFWSLRQVDPEPLERAGYHYISKKLSNGIVLVIAIK